MNADLAHAAIKLLRQSDPIFNQIPAVALESGLKSRPPCRFEIFKYKRKMKSEIDMKSRHNPLPGECEIDVIFDIAHNMDAVAALMKKMITHYPSNEFR